MMRHSTYYKSPDSAKNGELTIFRRDRTALASRFQRAAMPVFRHCCVLFSTTVPTGSNMLRSINNWPIGRREEACKARTIQTRDRVETSPKEDCAVGLSDITGSAERYRASRGFFDM